MNNEGLDIRFATLSDRAGAAAIHKLLFPNDPHYYANNIGLQGTLNLVAVKRDQIVGFVSVLINHTNPEGKYLWERMRPYIAFLGVLEEFRRLGVGRTLTMESSRKVLSLTGLGQIYLECGNENLAAQKFYENLGFVAPDSDEIERLFGRPLHPSSRVYRGEKYLF